MAKITRKFQRVFCGDVPANNVVAQFGSLKAGSPTYSSDPAVIQQLAAWGAGWTGATVTNSAPALQDMNSLFYVLSRQLGYVMQTGVPEYDPTTIYFIGSLASNSSGAIFKCLDDEISGVALSDTTKWVLFASNKQVSVSTNYTILYDDYSVIATGASSITATLPQATLGNKGRQILVKSNITTAGFLTVDTLGGSLINGLSDLIVSENEAYTFCSNGTGWDIISRSSPALVLSDLSTTTPVFAASTFQTLRQLVLPAGKWRVEGTIIAGVPVSSPGLVTALISADNTGAEGFENTDNLDGAVGQGFGQGSFSSIAGLIGVTANRYYETTAAATTVYLLAFTSQGGANWSGRSVLRAYRM